MSTSRRGSATTTPAADALPTAEQLAAAEKCELVDKDGKVTTFGEVTKGKKVAIIFIRHFWCGVCQTYIAQLATSIPPTSLPEGTSIIVIGCGNSQPIQAYYDLTECPYPIYGNPEVDLYKLFQFSVNLAPSKKGEEKVYQKVLGSQLNRVWLAIKAGPLKHIGHAGSVGPVSQNGGELLLEADGTASYMYRMQNTADHTDLDILAKVIGATYVPLPDSPKLGQSAPSVDEKRRASMVPPSSAKDVRLEQRRASEAVGRGSGI